MRAPEGQGRDRILIFEDTNGDGRLDSRKVFIENLNLVSGIEVGFGGVWVGAAPYLMFIPVKAGHGPAGRSAADPARRLGLSGHARDAQHVHVGPRRVALRHARRLHPLERRQARRARLRAPAAQRRDLALSSDQAHLRGLRRGHQQSVGPRLQRLRPCVHDRVRHRAPVSRRPGRAIQAAGRQALQPVRLRRHQDRRRSRALGRAPGTACRQQPIGLGRRRPRARRGDDLPRRRHLAERVPRVDLHEQHPRQPRQHRSAAAEGLGLHRLART